jgi:tetratricopeptide (TPR) repeat protein
LDDQRRLGWVSAYLSIYFTNMGDQDQALATGQRALTIATARGDFALEMMATFFLGVCYHSLGNYLQAIHYHRKNAEALRGEWFYERFGEPGMPSAFCRSFLAWSLAELGDFAEGLALGEEGIQIAEVADQPFTLSHAYFGVGLIYLRKGNLCQAIAVLESCLQVCQSRDIRLVLPWAASTLGYAYALSGRLAEAMPLLERAVEQSVAMHQMSWYALWLVQLGEAHLLAGRLEEACQLGQRALDFSRTHKERGYEAYALRLLGETAAYRDPPESEQAAAHYRQALALAEEFGMRPLQAHCHRSLGMLYAKTSQRELARTALSTAIALYRTMGMTFWLPQAEAALAQVEE